MITKLLGASQSDPYKILLNLYVEPKKYLTVWKALIKSEDVNISKLPKLQKRYWFLHFLKVFRGNGYRPIMFDRIF